MRLHCLGVNSIVLKTIGAVFQQDYLFAPSTLATKLTNVEITKAAREGGKPDNGFLANRWFCILTLVQISVLTVGFLEGNFTLSY